jgi:hypothetical protein
MTTHEAGIRLRRREEHGCTGAEDLAGLPSGSVVAVFANRTDASAAAGKLLTNDPDACLWLRDGRNAGEAIRAARSRRSFAMKVLRGFGDEELRVREVLRQADNGGSILVVRGSAARSLSALGLASHVYQFRVWAVRPLL